MTPNNQRPLENSMEIIPNGIHKHVVEQKCLQEIPVNTKTIAEWIQRIDQECQEIYKIDKTRQEEKESEDEM